MPDEGVEPEMGKYISKARREELANAGRQMTFDLQTKPEEFVPGHRNPKSERRLMLRTDDISMMRLGSDGLSDGDFRTITVINDFVSSRRGKRDLNNDHGLWTRFEIMSRDLDPVRPRCRNGIKCRACTREYPEGVLCTCHRVENPFTHNDPLTFTAYVTVDGRKKGASHD